MGQLNTITNYITQLLTQHVGQFTYLGQSMFLSFATIMIVWFGAKSALGSADRAGGFHFGNFASLIMMIAFGKRMLAIGIVPRIKALAPPASGVAATKGECHAVFVCTGTMMVTPSTVTAL